MTERLMCELFMSSVYLLFFFFNIPATPDISTLSLPDALPILVVDGGDGILNGSDYILFYANGPDEWLKDSVNKKFIHKKNLYRDRKSTRLNSSHSSNSYSVFCLKKKNKKIKQLINTSI